MAKLAIITVVYKNYTVLEDFMQSILKQKNTQFKLYVVDLTEEPKEITEILRGVYPESNRRTQNDKGTQNDKSDRVTVLHSHNKGYAHGVNVGLKKAREDGIEKFCVMNSDTYFEGNFVDSIQSFFTSYPKTIGGGKIYYAKGFEYHKNKYSPSDLGNVIWFAGGKIDWNHVITSHIGVDEIDDGRYNEEKNVDFLTGCLMFFDKSVLDSVGFWDESYFLYYEDADWCVRAKKAGIQLVYTPRVILWHKNAQSTDGAGSNIHTKYQKRNRVKFGLSYAPMRTKLHVLKNLIWNNK